MQRSNQPGTGDPPSLVCGPADRREGKGSAGAKDERTSSQVFTQVQAKPLLHASWFTDDAG